MKKKKNGEEKGEIKRKKGNKGNGKYKEKKERGKRKG